VVGLTTAAVLIAFFAGAIAWLHRRRTAVACRCFGTSTRPMGTAEIVRNVVLSVVALAAASAAAAGPRSDPSGAAVLLAALFGGGLALLAIRFDEVFRLFQTRDVTGS
jgi:hypothetical protein